jgi:hypothetical protein
MGATCTGAATGWTGEAGSGPEAISLGAAAACGSGVKVTGVDGNSPVLVGVAEGGSVGVAVGSLVGVLVGVLVDGGGDAIEDVGAEVGGVDVAGADGAGVAGAATFAVADDEPYST